MRSSAVGITEYMLIYYFSTEMKESPGKEKGCNYAPILAHHCIKMGVFEVIMSDRNTANKL